MKYTTVAFDGWVLEEEAERDRVYTMNAEVNGAMIGINETLRFRAVERHVNLHRKLD